METVSEVHSDLGYISKEKVKAWFPLRIPICPTPNHKHEPDSIRSARKDRNLDAIFQIAPDAERLSDGSVKMIIKGFQYTLWPSSDVFLETWRDLYKTGIEDLCERLSRRLSQI